ncbi:BTAD domain-containing putative transcriptional regulator [Angustibacter sp. McL0619]|uniref:BTAD domain-containing putative transcriptional regulator n=1 Tax=Angustibacter sp. McL0619 TaxID=3415676 RepID=UPI003CEE01F6
MKTTVHLLGRPRIERDTGEDYVFRSRKSWALLAYLLLAERPTSRSQLASLLFAEADDPIRALRWGLSEIRRGLGDDGCIAGDPVVLDLPPDTVVDVEVVARGAWGDAVDLPGIGSDLLEGTAIRGAPAFETWLLAQQRHVAAACEAILHEAALGSLSRGRLPEAIRYAARAAGMSPLDENHQALLIRLYRLAGDDEAAERQFALCQRTLATELGVAPGPAVRAALSETRRSADGDADDATVEAIVEAGSAAVSAGAIEAGVQSLRSARRLADLGRTTRLRVTTRQVLAEALIHSLRGLDEEGLAALYEADEIALGSGLTDQVAQVRAELGYVDFLRARYDRAEVWLTDALNQPGSSPATAAKATTYLGAVRSDRADYDRAAGLLESAVNLSRNARDPRREALALSMLGRVNLFRGNLDTAARQLELSLELVHREHWLGFVPWPQALRGEVQLACGDHEGAAELLQQAFARACQLGDPCWEGLSAHGLALVAEAAGEIDRAFKLLADARVRNNRMADSYVWLDAYILDTQCELGSRHGHPDVATWVETLRDVSSRTGMLGFSHRCLRFGADLGNEGDAAAATLLG